MQCFGILESAETFQLPGEGLEDKLWLICGQFQLLGSAVITHLLPPSRMSGSYARISGAACIQLAGARVGSKDPNPLYSRDLYSDH